MNFNVVRTRRVLIETTMAEGKRLPYGASVFDASENLVTVVGEDGTIFVPGAVPGMLLEVQNSGKTVCKIRLDLPEKTDTPGLYENAMAVCH